MNSANETLRAIKNRKALLTKKYHEDMAILEKEEKELLKTFKDIPVNEIYKKEE